jgi:hypothetical protein
MKEASKSDLVVELKKVADYIGHGKIKIELTVQEKQIKYIRIIETERQIKICDII